MNKIPRVTKSRKHRVWRFFHADGSDSVNSSSSLFPFRDMQTIGDWFEISTTDCVHGNMVSLASMMGKKMGVRFSCRVVIRSDQRFLRIERVQPRPTKAPNRPPEPRKQLGRPPRTGSKLFALLAAIQPGQRIFIDRATCHLLDPIEIARSVREHEHGLTMTRSHGCITVTRPGNPGN